MARDTKDRILAAALELFESEGYEGTTMRAIAQRAGVSTGNAYYWFASKDELVQAFYSRLQHQHAQLVGQVTVGLPLAERLRHCEHAWLDLIGPHHAFGSAFIGTALRPGAASPFSEASREARETSIGIYRDLVTGADPAPAKAWQTVLPELLWLGHLGITLFWVSDDSEGSRRTRALVDQAVDLTAGALRLARVPGSRFAAERTQRLLDLILRSDEEQ